MTWTSRKARLDPTRPRVPIIVEHRIPRARTPHKFSVTFIWLIDMQHRQVGLWCRRCYQVLHQEREKEQLKTVGYRHLREHTRSEAEMKRKGEGHG